MKIANKKSTLVKWTQKDLPKFKTVKEEAEFWDTHNVIDLSPIDSNEEKITFDTEEDFNYWVKFGEAAYLLKKKQDIKKEKMSEIIHIKVTPTIKKTLEKKAKSLHLTTSSFARMQLVKSL